MNDVDFAKLFQLLTGHRPFPWQEALFARFASGDWAEIKTIDIPTGLGKTSIMAIWLIALAYVRDKNGKPLLPRRLVYVVNRRTVVDQSTREAEKLRAELIHPQAPELVELASRLRELFVADEAAGSDATNDVQRTPSEHRFDTSNRASAGSDATNDVQRTPLAISTLRGQFADNQEWSADPARPAIIAGTVDMIGSRLLFSGYRIGFKSRPLHAAFLGQDALLIHDEAHLEPAFQELLEAIQAEQQRERKTNGELPWPKLRVMALSATSRGANDEASDDGSTEEAQSGRIGLTEKEQRPEEPIPDPPTEPIHHVWQRLTAKKTLHLLPNEDPKNLAGELADLAKKHGKSGQAVLIFTQRVDDVGTIVKQLPAGATLQLTGTLRGLERDQLVKKPIFRRFLPKSKRADDEPTPTETVYLVCTSAGEVGIDISADHMVCDLSCLDSMIQRLGRVNRFGDGKAEIHIVHPKAFDDKKKPSPLDAPREKTLELLRDFVKDARFAGNASPLNVGRFLASLTDEQRNAAFTPPPTILPATDILFDAWALTSIREKMPGRPPVEPYLHGIRDWEPPDTHVAWREEVEVVTGELLSRYEPKDLLEDYPFKPHEMLRDRSERVLEHLQTLAKKHPSAPIWIVDDQGAVELGVLGKVADSTATTAPEKKRMLTRLDGVTVLLPPNVGGLRDGLLDGSAGHFESTVYDVADLWLDDQGRPRRLRVGLHEKAGKIDEAAIKGMRRVRGIILPATEGDEDATGPTWDWYTRPLGDGRTAAKPVGWQTHVDDVVNHAERIAASLLRGDEWKTLCEAITLAAKLHDDGKRRALFQHTLGNRDFPARVLAKSGRYGARLPETYRHEFGSLLDAEQDPVIRALADEMQDVVLHLIATHHGRARPHFPRDEAYDPESNQSTTDAVNSEVPRRYARLQRKYGRWGLAYLESLLRAADWAASGQPSKFENEESPA